MTATPERGAKKGLKQQPGISGMYLQDAYGQDGGASRSRTSALYLRELKDELHDLRDSRFSNKKQ